MSFDWLTLSWFQGKFPPNICLFYVITYIAVKIIANIIAYYSFVYFDFYCIRRFNISTKPVFHTFNPPSFFKPPHLLGINLREWCLIQNWISGSVVTQTVGFYVDGDGNQIWICPQCKKPDDGSPMIGCDECDDWYHWVCELQGFPG